MLHNRLQRRRLAAASRTSQERSQQWHSPMSSISPHLVIHIRHLARPLQDAICKHALSRVQLLEGMIAQDGALVDMTRVRIARLFVAVRKCPLHSTPIQMQIDHFATALGGDMCLTGNVPSLLVDPMLCHPKLLDLLSDLFLIAKICLIVVGIFIGVDDACRQGALLFLGHAGATSVAVAVVPAVVNLRLL